MLPSMLCIRLLYVKLVQKYIKIKDMPYGKHILQAILKNNE